jgi:hypothetical protein
MKRCPQCRRRYSDESLNFCLDDGSPLIAEPDSDPTLVLPTVASRPTAPGTGVSPGPAPSSQSSYRWILVAAVILLAVVIGGGAVALLYRVNKWDSPNDGNTSKTLPVNSAAKSPTSEPDKSPPAIKSTPAKAPNLSGEWSMVNTIERTSYPAYANMRIGYHLVIRQTGTEFTADGEKTTENERSMSDVERTPIHVTGSVNQNSVSATYVEEGQRRSTSGRFDWVLATGGNQLRGTFSSTAAKSSGSSVATRER